MGTKVSGYKQNTAPCRGGEELGCDGRPRRDIYPVSAWCESIMTVRASFLLPAHQG